MIWFGLKGLDNYSVTHYESSITWELTVKKQKMKTDRLEKTLTL